MAAHATAIGGAATVLLVEQDPTVRDLADEVLRDLGHSVLLAEDGPDALRRLEAGVPAHVIVTDIGLAGGIGGVRLAEQARASRPDLKVLFLTGYADEAEAAAGAMVPGTAVLSKPFNVEKFVKCLRALLAGPTQTRR